MPQLKVVFLSFLIIGLLLSGTTSYALKEDEILLFEAKTLGVDQIPYSKFKLKSNPDLLAWIQGNYSDDQRQPIHYLPESLLSFFVRGQEAIAFTTWEYNNYVRNIVINKDRYLLFYTTPQGEFNPEGERVLNELLGVPIPRTNLDYSTDPETYDWSDGVPFLSLPVIPLSAFGTYVGSFNGVNAYSNSSTSYFSGITNTSCNNYATGYKWQCVEFVTRYFDCIYKAFIRGGNANTFYSNAAAKGLHRAPNGWTDKPRPGNLVCSAGGYYGHVAIVREVGSNYIKVIHQNWSNSSADNSKTLSMRVSNGNYTVSGFSGSYPVHGWLWK